MLKRLAWMFLRWQLYENWTAFCRNRITNGAFHCTSEVGSKYRADYVLRTPPPEVRISGRKVQSSIWLPTFINSELSALHCSLATYCVFCDIKKSCGLETITSCSLIRGYWLTMLPTTTDPPFCFSSLKWRAVKSSPTQISKF